jgi:hypothetical protein
MSDTEKLAWLVALIACPFAVLLMPSEEEDDG